MDYDARFLATAARMLAPKPKGKGQLVTLHEPPTDGSFDPSTDTTTGASPAQDHEGSGVEDRFSAFSIAQGVVAADDIKFLLSPLKTDGTPMPLPVADAWTIMLSGGVRTIKRVDAIRPAGTAVLIELTVRS